MTAMMERPAKSRTVALVTLEYKGDPDLHMYRRGEIDNTEMLHVFALCQDAALYRTPHAREDLSPFHHHAMYFCEGCWRAMETNEAVPGLGT